MSIRITRARAALVVLPLALPLSTAGFTAPAHAEDAAPTITEVTTMNESGGLTPYIPLYSKVLVEFTDATPSDIEDYRVDVPGVGSYELRDGYWEEDRFAAIFPVYDLEHGRTYDISVRELDGDGELLATSAPTSYTFRFVKHPRKFLTSAKKVGGRLTYPAGGKAKFRFKGTWESGARFHTQVWVSKRKKFTPKDWSANVYGNRALVSGKVTSKPVASVKIPRRLKGRHIWVSVLLWKDGRGGWVYSADPAKVVRR